MLDGFIYKHKRILFIDPQGKDANLKRWRITLYYAPNQACTVFFLTEKGYKRYLKSHIGKVYLDYAEFVAAWIRKEIMPVKAPEQDAERCPVGQVDGQTIYWRPYEYTTKIDGEYYLFEENPKIIKNWFLDRESLDNFFALMEKEDIKAKRPIDLEANLFNNILAAITRHLRKPKTTG